MMLISSIVVMCLNLYLVCLVFQVLKNTYLKNHFSVVASKYSPCDMKNNLYEFKLCSVLKRNIAPMEYNANEKETMIQVEYNPIVSSSSEKSTILWQIIFRTGNRHGKRQKKYCIKDKMSIKISLMDYMKCTKLMLLVIFEEFIVVCISFCYFFFTIIVNFKKFSKLF